MAALSAVCINIAIAGRANAVVIALAASLRDISGLHA